MAYFKINNIDFSKYVNALKVNTTANYNLQTNAAGDGVADYINKKRNIEVGIIPVDSNAMKELLAAIDAFNVSVSFRNPTTGALAEGVNCIIPSNEVEYYTIQAEKVLYKAFNLNFIEL
jgi:hypothetical protein